MRYLLNTLVSLTFVLIGFALAQPARAIVTEEDTTAPVISNIVVIPGTWTEVENISGEVRFDFNDGTDPFIYDFTFAFTTAGPIAFFGGVALTPFISVDESGYIDTSAVATFTYAAGSGFGIFDLDVAVTDPFNNQGVGMTSYTINAVPEPAAISLFAVGLAGLGFLMRRRKNRHGQT